MSAEGLLRGDTGVFTVSRWNRLWVEGVPELKMPQVLLAATGMMPSAHVNQR